MTRCPPSSAGALVDMRVSTLAVDPFTNMPMVILEDEAGRQAVPIWIGLIEATAIATELEQVELARPSTHDLMTDILGRCGVRLDRVEVTDLRAETFYATLHLVRSDGSQLVVDARPSDAIALALRARASIRVARKVIEKARRLDLRRRASVGTPPGRSRNATPAVDPGPAGDSWLDYLETLGENAFGRWKM